MPVGGHPFQNPTKGLYVAGQNRWLIGVIGNQLWNSSDVACNDRRSIREGLGDGYPKRAL